ncbi:Uu.00g014070.m01.CDS01 [Anthostomella pinea]|uniref:Mediator of RNA polymerase II transcription subunit 16 n=1 Tax=Anthostomella pinea TaxID=933095 RepID=A0AAI8VZH2_9PEZI|nr:Uu.00g014070.m01.CDS01 [Anthostomella pinea]
MTNNGMPLILDGSLGSMGGMGAMGGAPIHVNLEDVDDLFGDGVPLSLPPRPPSRRLRQRLDELRGRGCCKGIAWSKGGTIASIAPDGQSLQLSYLRADPKDATWALSEPKEITPWASLAGGPIVHLHWSPANSELAVVDAVGRVLILNFNADLNNSREARKWDGDAIDDLHAVVGSHWLNPIPSNSRYHPVYTPAIKSGKGFEYVFENKGLPSMGPSHPNPNRSAFICITTNGLFKMYWSQNTGIIEEKICELESVTSADDLITHAAVCADKTMRTIFIAMATTSKQLRVVQVMISFNAPKPENPPSIPPGGFQLNPSLGKRHIAVTSWGQTASSESPLDMSMAKISHLEMLPALFNMPTKDWSPMILLTVRTFVPEPNSPYGQEVQSIIDRWELLTDQKETPHAAFEQLGSRRNSMESAPPVGARLKKLDSTIVNKVVMGISVLSFGKVICLTYNDGSIEYRDRFSMNELYREVNLDQIYSILEAGFTQTGEPGCLQMAFSPSNFSLVQMYEDGKVKWHNLAYTLEDVTSISDAHLAAVNAAFVMSTAGAGANGANIDDILAVARKFIHKDHFAVKWATDMVQINRSTIDYSEESPHDHLIRNNTLQLCFSILNHLGWEGEFKPRHYRSKFAVLALNMRNIVILVSLASNAPNAMRGSSSPLDEPEVVDALAGCTKWSIDLICWLCDCLFCLLTDSRFMGFLTQSNQSQLVYMTQYLQSKNEIALHLILCSSTRNLLSALCRRINLLDSCSARAIQWYRSRGEVADNSSREANHKALYAAYKKIQRHTASALIKADEFDKLLTTLATDIRSAYNTSGLAEQAQKAAKNQPPNQRPDLARQYVELNLMLVQTPAPQFLAVTAKFFRNDLTEFREHAPLAKLYFKNYELLEIDDEPKALEKRRAKGMMVDLFRRVEMSRSCGGRMRFKRCSRCASVMEDISHMHNKPGISFLLSQQRTCCCGGRLSLLP